MPVLLSFSYSIISIHALLAESDEFQSVGIAHLFISIHALLAESDSARKVAAVRAYKISIHALLAESDDTGPRQRGPDGHFYPRSPCGERPPAGKVRPWASHISIHALLAESDNRGWCNTMAARRISIHALLAESDRHWQMGHSLTRQFLSTLSLRRATAIGRWGTA